MSNFTLNEINNPKDKADSNARENYLAAIVEIQQLLLVSQNPHNVYDEILAVLGRASGAGRVCIFENHADSNGRFLTSRKAEWCAAGIKSQIDNPVMQGLDFDLYAHDWLETLSHGGVVNELVKNLPDPLHQVLEAEDVLSILVLPLIVNNEFFGLICFDNCVEEKLWTETDIKFLRAVAQAVCLAIERYRAESERRESETVFREIVDNANDLIYLIDLEGNFLNINKTCERVTGYTLETLPNKNIAAVVAPEYLEIALHNITLKLSGKATESVYELALLTKDGRRIPVEVSTRIIRRDGKPIAIQGIARDITERKRAEKELYDYQERFVTAFNSSPVPLIITKLSDGTIIDVNDTALRLHNFTRQELLGKTTSELKLWIKPDNREEVIAELKKKGSLDDFEAVLRGKSGTTRIALISAKLITINNEASILWTAIDITEIKKAEESLRESEERYRIVAETATDAIITIDQDGKIIFANPAAERIFGYSVDEMTGNRILMLMPERLRDAHIAGISRYIKTGKRHISWEGIEIVGKHKDGHEIPLENSFGEIVKDGKRYFTGIIRDITERKQAEQALHESQERLRQAQKLEAIGRLAGGIAHDFNNILTSIIGYSDISLRRIPKDDPLHHNLAEIRKSADRAANLTQQLLAYSRKQILQPSLLDLNEIVTDMEKMLHRLIGENVMLDIRLAERPGTIKADRGQIEQVLMNLVVNARDAMPKGGKVFVRTANVEIHEPISFKAFTIPPDKYVLLQVSDTGHGMSEEVKTQLFEPFFTTKAVGKGTGLGLATVYGIIKQSGGYIIVESEMDKGTTFNIYLPLSHEEKKTADADFISTEPKHGVETILLAEDDEIVRNLTQEVLESAGYKVLVSNDCDDAIDICKKYEDKIHLLLTDVVMPKISGRELAEQLLLIRPQMKVLYMSGYTDDDIVSHGVLDEGVNLIQKPYTINDLTRKVRELLDLHERI